MSKPFYGVGNVSGVCGWYPQFVTVIVIKTGSNLISLSGVDSKVFPAFSKFVG